MTDFATINRRKKALDMAQAIDDGFRKKFPKLCPHDQAGRILLASEGWTDDMWLRLAQRAGYKSKKTPGEATRLLVQKIYRGRATAPLQKRAS